MCAQAVEVMSVEVFWGFGSLWLKKHPDTPPEVKQEAGIKAVCRPNFHQPAALVVLNDGGGWSLCSFVHVKFN